MFWPDRTMAQFVGPAGAFRIPAPLKKISPQETAVAGKAKQDTFCS